MKFLNCIDVSASGLTAQRLRMDTIANNMANAETTRKADGSGPYKRQVVVFEAKESEYPRSVFRGMLEKQYTASGGGVRVRAIQELDEKDAPFRMLYEPGHQDADENGYVKYPNVNVVEEMINMISSTKAYEANAKVIEASKNMAMRALDIGN
ncbi:flagellar basal-body rod protein flgc [hydrocarbon metagenome]|uniref:Flagellar basal-body rod protein FlgC n=1 Tax=hydrocarbon metagenome TaxID=938273 RepID=A0A0W8E4Q3_9ZZZZ